MHEKTYEFNVSLTVKKPIFAIWEMLTINDKKEMHRNKF